MGKEKKVKTNVPKKSRKKGKISFFNSIRAKLLASFMLPVAGIIVVGLISYNKASESVINGQVDSAVRTVESIDVYIELIMSTVRSNYKIYIDTDELKDYFNGTYDKLYPGTTKKADVRQEFLTKMYDHIKEDPLIEDIMFISDEHESISTNAVKDTSLKLYSTYVATKNGETALSNQYNFNWFGNVSEADSVLGSNKDQYALRMVRKFSSIKALMIVDVDMGVITEALDNFEAGEGGYVALVTDDGAEIFSSQSTTSEEKVFFDKSFYQEALTNREESGATKVEMNGQVYRFIYSKIEGTNFVVCSLVSENHLLEQVKDIQTITIIVVIISALVAIGVAVVFTQGISSTIKNIVGVIDKVAQDDFTVEVKSKRKDEFRLMTDALQDTVLGVKELITSVRDVNTELVQSSERVYDSSKLFVETSENIKQSVDEIKSGTNRLDEDSDNCLAQMDGLSEKITTVTSNTNEIERIVTVTNDSIMAGISSIESVTENTHSTTRITGEVIEAIGSLEDKTRSIVDFVEIINGIAEETTLLSLNASIEAARAGEAGRGFAVVAGEINKLADQSMNSAGQIGDIVKEILDKTSQVVNIAKEAFEIVQKQDEAVTGTTEAFNEMRENINTLLVSLEKITQNVANIEGARDITLEAVENISSVSAQTSACSVSVGDTVESQNAAIAELNNAAGVLAEKSAMLTALLEKFTI